MSALQGYTGGYPYLRIARHYGLDYGDVLNWPFNFNSQDRIHAQIKNDAEHDAFADDTLAARRHFSRLSRGEIRADEPFA